MSTPPPAPTDLAERIRERLDQYGKDIQGNAVRAVLARHKPDLYGGCADCRSADGNDVPWPCDTVTDIARALEIQ